MERSMFRQRAAMAAVLMAVVACSDGDAARVTPPVVGAERLTVKIAKAVDSILIGDSRQLSARVTDQTGSERNVAVAWSSLTPSVVTIANGTATALALGEARIIASVGTSADTATLVVTPPQMVLRITPGAVSATLGDTLRFEAVIVGPSGASTRVGEVAWTVSDSARGRLIDHGVVATRGEGMLDVIATVAGFEAAASVKVNGGAVHSITISPANVSLPVGGTQQLVAELRDNRGRLVTGRDVKWSSSSGAIATVDLTGQVTAVAVGGASITATAGGKSASAAVNVHAPSASSVSFTIPRDSIAVSATMQATATAYDANGNPISGRPMAWQSSNPAVATISNTGVITGLTAGQTTISVICDGQIASRRLTVVIPAAHSIAVVPSTARVLVGATSPLTAEVRNQLGTVMSGASVTWASSAPAVASVSATGEVTGVSLGSASVRATSGSLSATASVTVENVPVASVTLTPSSASVEAGKTVSFVATALDANGNTLANRPVSWTSSAAAVATVSTSGVVTGVAAGNATIVATIEGKSASSAVSVSEPPSTIAYVTVTLNSPVLAVGERTRAFAKAHDSSGNELTGLKFVFRSGNTSTASVSEDGAVRGEGPGSTTISAFVDGKGGLTSVTVQSGDPLPVHTISLSIGSSSLAVGDSTQLTVALRDSTGTLLTDRTIAFTSSNTSVVQVTGDGMVRAIGSGSATIVAQSEGRSASVGVTVASSSVAPVASVSVALQSSALSVGQSTQATATLRDASGAILSGRVIAWSSSNTAVATVSQSGGVTALSAGSAVISAQSEGQVGSASLTVTAPAVASVSVTLSPTSIAVGSTSQATAVARDASGKIISGLAVSWAATGGGVVTLSGASGSSITATGASAGSSTLSATVDGVTGGATLTVTSSSPSAIALPAMPTLLNFSYPRVTGTSWVVKAGDNLQTIINNAKRGDEIVLPAGVEFTGNFTLPNKTGTSSNGWILIRSSQSASLPPQGTRVSPTHAPLMPRLVSPNTTAALATQPGTNGWWISGVEFTIAPTVTHVIGRVVAFGSAGSAQNSLSQVPYDLVLDRVYIHPQANQNVQRCLEFNSARSAVQDSYLFDCHAKGFDSQAIVMWNGPGPFKIVNNMLAGAGENIMFGGADPSIAGLVPGDAEIRGNYFYTPASWKGVWTKKNLFETKNATRVLLEGNVFDGSWSDGQVGYAFVLKVANQSGSCTWCTADNIIIRNNLIRNVGAGFGITGREGANSHPTGALLNKLLIENNIVENVNVSPYTGDGRLISIMQNPSDVTIRNNTMTAPGSLAQYLNLGTNPAATNFAFSGNIASYGSYGFFSSWYGIGETVNLPSFRGTVIFENSVLIGSQRSGYPNATFVSSLSAAQATGYGANVSAVLNATQGVAVP